MNKIFWWCFFTLLLTACYDDEGNYDYKSKNDITITGIPEKMALLGSAEHIVCDPTIHSALEGEITEDNPNYEFKYRIDYKSGHMQNPWPVLNPRGNLKLDTLAGFSPGTYTLWFTVTDKRTGVSTSAFSELKITSVVYEGYMILCNEGPEKRARLDMIAVISDDRILPAYNVLEPLGLPDLKRAVSIGFNPSLMAGGDQIYIFTEEGGYKLDPNSFETDESEHVKYRIFMVSTVPDQLLRLYLVNNYYQLSAEYLLGVTDLGNVYSLRLLTTGSAFEYPVNTPVRGQTPDYRVAPYLGVSGARNVGSSSALLYDVDNKRFIGWNSKNPQTATPLNNPEQGALFDYRTGMDLIYMEGTQFSNGLVYAVLQDDGGTRHVYGINLAGNNVTQEACYRNIAATDFNKAEHFAFHSQFPFMYYAAGNQVYSCNLATGQANPVIPLADSERVTLLKFNLFQNPGMSWKPTDDFRAKQYELMVGTYDDHAADGNGGKLRFYKVNNIDNTLTLQNEYSGFGEIVDVVYRERR